MASGAAGSFGFVRSIFLIGATGGTGLAVLRSLQEQEAGEPRRLTCLARNERAASMLDAQGVAVVRGDIAEARALREGMADAECVCLITPDGPAQADKEMAVFRAALDAGGRHIVKLSAITAARGVRTSFGRSHGKSEDALVASGLPHTIVRPTMFFQSLELFADPVLKIGRLILPTAPGAVAMVSRDDVGACLARICSAPAAHLGRTYTLTGPAALTMDSVAAALSHRLSRQVKHVSPSPFLFRLMLRSLGAMDGWTAAMVSELMSAIREGAEDCVSPDVGLILGRFPIDLNAYLQTQKVFRQARRGD